MSEEPQVTGDQISEAAAPVDSVQSDVQIEQEPQEQRTVPLEALESERAQRQGLQDELKMMKDHIALMQVQQPTQQKAPPPDEFSSMADEDVLTVGEAKKIVGQMNKQYKTNIEELRMQQRYPDYQEVVTKYLPEVIKANPGLRNTLESSQDYELAYYLAKNSDACKGANKTVKRNADAERIVQNANRAGSLSSVGQTSAVSEAKRYKDMSADEFQRLTNKNLGCV